VRAVFRERRAQPMVGILIRNRIGMDVYGTNTRIEQVESSGLFEAGEELEIDFTFECWLTPQQYTVTVATQHPDGSSHDWLDDVITFDVVSPRVAAGVVDLQAKIECRKLAARV
jgi:lipopolysaccharide transport system ATP-binding protein